MTSPADPDRCRCTWDRIDGDECCTDDDCGCITHHQKKETAA